MFSMEISVTQSIHEAVRLAFLKIYVFFKLFAKRLGSPVNEYIQELTWTLIKRWMDVEIEAFVTKIQANIILTLLQTGNISE